jgi:hypothetical protein
MSVDVDKTNGLPLNAFYTVSGSPVVNYRFVRLVEGSPFFRENWMNCVALSSDGKRFKCHQVKLELVYNDVYYLNEKGEEFICTEPLKEMVLTDTVTNASYQFVHSSHVPALAQSRQGWYLRLVNGKASLYQAFVKSINEAKQYGSAVTDQRINTAEEYLIVYDGRVMKCKKPKEVPALIADGKKELESFLKSDEIKQFTTAEQMTAMINMYNNLQ